MLTPDLLDLIREPVTGSPLLPGESPGRLRSPASGFAFRVEGGAIDLSAPLAVNASAGARAADTAASAGSPASPELREYHDQVFEAPNAEQLYDNLFDLPKLTQSAHFRRMEILAGLDLPDLTGATAVDFGSGPWGFASVFPRLHGAAIHVTCDVSFEALLKSQAKPSREGAKRLFITSDGDSIGLRDESADIVWAGEVIEHVRSPRLFLQEVARVLRPGGLLVLSTPNRDAPLYAARGLQNTVGPEHIALMSWPELCEAVSTFFSITHRAGFEFSLWHEWDPAIVDENVLGALQRRAEAFPELSSGIVLAARVDKSRLRGNARRWSRQESGWEQWRLAAGTHRAVPLFGPVAGGFLEEGTVLESTVDATTLVLLFWSHPWSGKVRVRIDGVAHEFDLYSHAGGFRRLEFRLEPGRAHDVAVERTGSCRAGAQSTEVIFYKSIAYVEGSLP